MRTKFFFTKSMANAIFSAGLSERDEGALYRAILNYAFSGANTPELTKVTKPMFMLIAAMIDDQQCACMCESSTDTASPTPADDFPAES